MAGRGEIGMGQSEDVAEFVEQHAAEIGGYGLGGWTPGGAAKGIQTTDLLTMTSASRERTVSPRPSELSRRVAASSKGLKARP